MAAPTKKSFDHPDEHLDLPGIVADVVDIADATISRVVYQPGTHCPQVGYEGNPVCNAHHTGYVIAGRLHVEMTDGSVIEVGSGEVFDIPAGHDGWATGDEPLHAVSWSGSRTWLSEGSRERVLVTLLLTDIVGSTEAAVAMGDQDWSETLAGHNRGVRNILDRFRGREVATTGDGFLAVFDGAGRAIEAAVAIRDRAKTDGLSIRSGVHTGEVEMVGDDLRGVTVHEVARISAAADPDEILVSETSRLLAPGLTLGFEQRGPFALKGLNGDWTLYAVGPLRG